MSLEYYSGKWHIAYYPDGRYGRKIRIPVPISIQDRRPAAQKYHNDFIREWKAAKGKGIEEGPLTGLTIGQLWPEYLKWSELHHAETTHADVVYCSRRILRHLGPYDAESLGIHHVQIYQRMRSAEAGRPIPRQINKELAYHSGFVRWAGKQGHITPRKLASDPLPYKRPMPQVLTVNEVKRILAAAEPFYRAYLICLYALGFRGVEARNLKWKDVNFERGVVNVIQKGGSTKSLPMGTALLSSLKAIAPPAESLEAYKGDLPVFESPKKPGQAVKDVRKAIRRAMEKADITRRVTPHLFRHSCATHMIDEGVDVSIVREFLGHTDIKTTQRYVHISLENLRQAQNLISGGINRIGHNKGGKVYVWPQGKIKQ
jgi:integrase